MVTQCFRECVFFFRQVGNFFFKADNYADNRANLVPLCAASEYTLQTLRLLFGL